ncbi:MAG TPA: hypothetical protein DIW15_00335 [Bavariicoccus seileri]|uniref:Uncharacterized protein n=1 Tax=Bavariicoccus seileri TaxID=549685 RepID=A0A3D4S3R1_9ENTE|nr:hypothetical protein [Bavariicoccus seileri]HCS93142.1 hypothetical protein [Bavariicoccus seileri]
MTSSISSEKLENINRYRKKFDELFIKQGEELEQIINETSDDYKILIENDIPFHLLIQESVRNYIFIGDISFNGNKESLFFDAGDGRFRIIDSKTVISIRKVIECNLFSEAKLAISNPEKFVDEYEEFITKKYAVDSRA